MSRNRIVAACLLSTVLLVACEEKQQFEDVLPQQEEIGNFERVRIPGGARYVLDVAEVAGDMIHPEFIGRWSNLKREIEVELYILRLEDYDETVPPRELRNVFWTSVPEDGVGFGERVVTEMHVHPTPGPWILFFYNPHPFAPSTEAELSANVRLAYFR